MRLRLFLPCLLGLSLSACAAVLGLPDPALDETAGSGDGAGSEGGADGGLDEGLLADARAEAATLDAKVDGGACDLTAPWTGITRLDGLASNADEDMPSLTADERRIFFRRGPPDGQGSLIYTAQRGDGGVFGPAEQVAFSPVYIGFAAPCVTGAGDRIFYSLSQGGQDLDVYSAPLPDAKPETFEQTLKSAELDFCGSLASDGSMIMWRQPLNQNATYFEAKRSGATFAPPTPLPGFPPQALILGPRPVISADGLTIFYEAATDSASGPDIYMARRSKPSDPFAQHAKVTELASTSPDGPGWLSPDGCRMYFSSARPGGAGGRDLYVASRPK